LFGLALQADQKLVAVGWVGSNTALRDFALARFLTDRVFPTGDPSQIVRLYRAYNVSADYHFFTTNYFEWQAAINAGLRDESTNTPGIGVYAGPAPGSLPIYRLYNPNTGKHYYTLNLIERDNLQSIGWRYESIEGFMFDSQAANTTPIYRLYNKSTGTHLYTHELAVRNYILNTFPTWEEHSQFGYAFAWPLNFSASAESPAVAAALTAPAKSEDEDTAPAVPVADSTSLNTGLIAPAIVPAIATGPAEAPVSESTDSAALQSVAAITQDPAATAIDTLFTTSPWDWLS